MIGQRPVAAWTLSLALALVGACSSLAPSGGAPTAPGQSGSAPGQSGAGPGTARAAEKLKMGVLGASTDAGFFIAMDRGYFAEQGLDLDTTPFDSAARMVAPLGAGQLDVGGGAHNAGLFNAVARGIPLKLVADKGSTPPGFGFQALLFRNDLADAGQLRGPGDLRGLRVAVSARGTSAEVALAEWLATTGLTLDDITPTELDFADHATALAGGGVEASVTIEPFLTRILDQGTARLYQRTDEQSPGRQVAEIIYSGDFAREQPDLARRFMVAYVRAL